MRNLSTEKLRIVGVSVNLNSVFTAEESSSLLSEAGKLDAKADDQQFQEYSRFTEFSFEIEVIDAIVN